MYRFFSTLLLSLSLTVSAHAGSYWLFFEGVHSPGDPVDSSLIATVEGIPGCTVRTVSRYFNAVSVDYNGGPSVFETLNTISRVTAVREMSLPSAETGIPTAETAIPSTETAIPPVAADIPSAEVGISPTEAATTDAYAAKTASDPADHKLSYGISYPHLDALNIPAVHDLGLTGEGVLIGVLDSGFNAGDSGVLADADIRAQHNFITGDSDISGDNHGTYVLSLLAASLEGAYYGAAYGASYLLAVTDAVVTETRADEDRWVAAIEWCDSHGADIIVSSLVYNIFDTAAESYAPEDMDGATSLVAEAAEIAWSRGMIVINSVGNEGANSWGIVTTPADAEHVIAVGSVQQDWQGKYVLSAFSSHGPTADGRIKPDFVAPGVLKVPEPGSTLNFPQLTGTSLAAPLIGGALALVMEANPGRDKETYIRLLKESAVDMGDPGPDNFYGLGMIDCLLAVTLDDNPTTVTTGNSAVPVALTLLNPYPNPFNPSITIPLEIADGAPVTLEALTVTGQRSALIHDAWLSAGKHKILWNADGLPTGSYFIRVKSGEHSSTHKILLIK